MCSRAKGGARFGKEKKGTTAASYRSSWHALSEENPVGFGIGRRCCLSRVRLEFERGEDDDGGWHVGSKWQRDREEKRAAAASALLGSAQNGIRWANGPDERRGSRPAVGSKAEQA